MPKTPLFAALLVALGLASAAAASPQAQNLTPALWQLDDHMPIDGKLIDDDDDWDDDDDDWDDDDDDWDDDDWDDDDDDDDRRRYRRHWS